MKGSIFSQFAFPYKKTVTQRFYKVTDDFHTRAHCSL